jgi:hypothetical protein
LWQLLPAARKADVVVLQRVLPPRPLLAVLARTAPLVFDVDDALGTLPELQGRLRAMTGVAEVVAGNEEIARTLPGSPRVAIIPTVVDPAAYGPPRPHDGPLRIGWIGTPENLPFLDVVRPALAGRELRVISSAAPTWPVGARERLHRAPGARHRPRPAPRHALDARQVRLQGARVHGELAPGRRLARRGAR